MPKKINGVNIGIAINGRIMKTNSHGIFKKGFALLELLFSTAIIVTLGYIGYQFYFKRPPVSEQTQEALSEYGINASSQKAILEDAKSRIEDVNKQILENHRKLLEDYK